ncbi:MAG: flagellar hook assembly protein FlgD [Betaproteobacteria bacterium]|nr:flagellar hook assembly protein FlgD [Betaproteobacteria bacterium]
MAVDTNIINALNSAPVVQQQRSVSEEMSERFMTLFLAQLRNQDPLNPMENAEMTSQLAQMNMVSGLEKLNSTMNTLLASYNEALSLQAANLIGKNVLVPGNQVILTDEGALFGLELSGPADRVEVVIRDASGREVARKDLGQLDAGSQAFYWDGTDPDGNLLEPGYYTFEIGASLDGAVVLGKTMQVGMVSALVRGGDGFRLEVLGLGSVGLDDVRQVF